MDNPIQTVASQYANSPTLVQLIQSMNQYFDPSINFADFYEFVWNVDTAQGFGLDIWGRIVNVSRNLTIPGDVEHFGFEEAGDAEPFDQAPFYNGDSATETYTLLDDAYRTLILTKALANISDSSAPSLNRLLQNLFFGRGRCYVIDGNDMSMKFVFEFELEPFEIAIMQQAGIIPRPAAVGASIFIVNTESTLGFAQSIGSQPFGSGVFFNSAIATIPIP